MISALILSSVSSYAQMSGSELKKLQKEASFKIITIEIQGVKSDDRALKLKSDLESIQDVHDCEVDYQNNLCKLIAGFGVQKSDVLGITGRSQVKTANYSEEVRWQTNQNSKNRIQHIDEKARAEELNYRPEEEEKLQREIEITRKLEGEIAEKEKQEARGTQYENDLPEGYPRYLDSGNQVEDERKYSETKEEWIENNPEKYRQISAKDKNSVTKVTNAEFKKMSAEKQQVIKSNPTKYKVIK
ncbi:MAG: hypothetical protein JKX73_01295 [Flavobacteriales bacterium]|nr:hypothetical protein [Flavobacteriales bacterium]